MMVSPLLQPHSDPQLMCGPALLVTDWHGTTTLSGHYNYGTGPRTSRPAQYATSASAVAAGTDCAVPDIVLIDMARTPPTASADAADPAPRFPRSALSPVRLGGPQVQHRLLKHGFCVVQSSSASAARAPLRALKHRLKSLPDGSLTPFPPADVKATTTTTRAAAADTAVLTAVLATIGSAMSTASDRWVDTVGLAIAGLKAVPGVSAAAAALGDTVTAPTPVVSATRHTDRCQLRFLPGHAARSDRSRASTDRQPDSTACHRSAAYHRSGLDSQHPLSRALGAGAAALQRIADNALAELGDLMPVSAEGLDAHHDIDTAVLDCFLYEAATLKLHPMTHPSPAHVDLGIMTLLVDDGPGLEIYDDATASWSGPLRLRDDEVVIMVNRHVEQISRGGVKACRHRVARVPGGDRISMVLEVRPNLAGERAASRAVRQAAMNCGGGAQRIDTLFG